MRTGGVCARSSGPGAGNDILDGEVIVVGVVRW